MGPRKPSLEYISLQKLNLQKQKGRDDSNEEAYQCLERLANGALKSGPFSITFHKAAPHIAPSADTRDFLSYAPYWWPVDPQDPNTKYIRKDGQRNPDITVVKDQFQLESLAENLAYLCLGYYFFSKENYAIHATSLLDTFFVNEKTRMNPNLNYVQLVRGSQNSKKIGRGEGVISSRELSRIANIIPLLDTFHGFDTLKQHVKNWFGLYLNWLQESPVALEASKAKNNIYTWYMVQLVSVQHFVDPLNVKTPKMLLKFFNESLLKQIDIKNGNQPLESKRAKPFHYLAFNMQAIIFLAQIAQSIGLNFYSPDGIIHLAINYITRLAGPQCKDDITEAVRWVEIVLCEIDDRDGCCSKFIEKAYQSKDAEKIKGPKFELKKLWSC